MPTALLLILAATQLPSPVDPGDVVVTARREPVPAAIELLRHWCFDPLRRAGRFDVPDWSPLDDAVRARFGAADPATIAVALADPARHRTLVMKQEVARRDDGLAEQRCTLAVVGGADDTPALIAGVSRLLDGPGTQAHVSSSHGVPVVQGWRQWLWSAIPQHGASDWRVYTGTGASRAAGHFIVVHDPALFYLDHDYVFVDLKVRIPGPALAMLTLGRVSRPDPPRDHR